MKKRRNGGLPNTSRLNKEIWDEFNSNWEELAFQSELLIAQFGNKTIEEVADIDISNLPVGHERESIVKVRVNQHFFRQSVVSIYGTKCQC